MITSGSLKSMDLLKILKNAVAKSFTGTITLKGKTGLASITLKGGEVVFIREPRIRSRLGRYLVSRNIITEKELQGALNAQKKKGGTFLGEVLIEQGVIDKESLDQAMKNVAEESLVHLFTWEEGLFRVEEEDVPGDSIGDIDYEALAGSARQLASAVVDDWAIDEMMPKETRIKDDIREEIFTAVRRVSQKLRELKPDEVVLLVEDEMLMREMFRDKLTTFGFEVDAVESPHKALELLSQYEEDGKIPIVITDLIMPTLSGKGIFGGLELLEEIQKTHGHIPVIVNTAYPDPSIRRRALFLGATYYINKPERKDIAPDQLENQLNLFIEEVALCIQNVIQRHEVYFERDHQNILREELLSQLIQSREELQKVGEVVQRDSGDIKFLSETSAKMVRDKSLGKMAEVIVNFAAAEMDRCAILLVRKDDVTGFYGSDRRPRGEGFGGAIKGLAMSVSDSPLLRQAVEGKKVVTMENPGDQLGAVLKGVLGDPPPHHTVVLPIMVQNMAVALLYGDVVPGGPPPREIESLEILMNLASLSLEIQQQQVMIKRLKGS
ncbi:MAG: response regulator [bacterium]|nr:response regulator [bacterium]MDT8396316.1 response regulator [bacterium]